MGISVRSRLVAGFTVVVVGGVAIPPPAPVPAAAEVRTAAQVGAGVHATPRIELAANVADTVRNIVSNPPNPAHFAAAGEAMSRITSSSAPQPAARTPRAAALPPAPPVTFNAASDGIVAAYQAIQYWVDYGVQLSSYVLQFVPLGYQINIFYYNLIRPIADSVVYGLIVPVVNDPLNPASYVNGLITVGQASVKAAINTGIAEFNQFFGWLIPPLPPRPLVSTAAVAKASAPEAATAKSVEPVTDPPIDVAREETPTKLPEPAAPDVSSTETTEPTDQTPAKATPKVDADTAVPTAPVTESVPVAAGTEKTPLKARGSATSTSTADADDDSPEAAEHPAKKTTADKKADDKPTKADGSDEKVKHKKAKEGNAENEKAKD